MSEDRTQDGDRGEIGARRFALLLFGAFAGCLLAIAGINAAVDPYRANGWLDLGLARERVSPVLNQRLWKLEAFDRRPEARIVLGDSRCDRFRSESFARAGVPGVANLSFGGGSLYESIDAWRFARERVGLEWVVVCVGFDVFHEDRTLNGVGEARGLVERPITYYLSPFVLRSSAALLRERWTGVARSERPDMSREAFWRHQLGPEVIGSSYRTWRRPERLWRQLEDLARGAAEDGTALVFVIPPNHVDLQAAVDEHGLAHEYAAYKAQLASLAPVLDFDTPNEWTRDAARWEDPYHAKPEVYERAVEALVLGPREGFGRWITPDPPAPRRGGPDGVPPSLAPPA